MGTQNLEFSSCNLSTRTISKDLKHSVHVDYFFLIFILFITEGKTFQFLTGVEKGSGKESGNSYPISSHGDKSGSKDMEEEQFADNTVVGSAEFFEDLESHRAIKVGHSLP